MTLSTFRPASKNVNRHTARGLKALQDSMRSVGYTEPMVAAADGEMLSGSARLESVADVFGLEVEPVVVHTTGNQPIIHVRDDIPNAHTKAAQKIALGANRIHQVEFDVDVQVLTSFDADVLDGLWTGDELSNLGQQWIGERGNPDDPNAEWQGMPEFDREPLAYRTIHIHFKTPEDVNDFAKVMGQEITDATRFLWHPFQAKRDLKSIGYVADES